MCIATCKTARWLTGSFFLLAVLLLAGCGGRLQTGALLRDPGKLQQRVEIKQVPFFPQEKYLCGPASLSTVLNYAGARVTPAELTPKVFLPGRRGSLQIELLTAVRRLGYIPYVIKPELRTLYTEIAAGHPVLVLQNLGLSWYPRWHYAVVIGFDLDKRRTILRSGTIRRYVMSMKTFERTWRRSGRWALLVLAPDQLPQTAEQLPYLRSVAGLERVRRWSEANIAYRRALLRWPQSLDARIGLGNSYYAQKNLAAASTTYRRAIHEYPRAAVAYNNLAQVLMEQGKLKDAEWSARQAITIGGRFLSDYRDTLEKILAKRKAAVR